MSRGYELSLPDIESLICQSRFNFVHLGVDLGAVTARLGISLSRSNHRSADILEIGVQACVLERDRDGRECD